MSSSNHSIGRLAPQALVNSLIEQTIEFVWHSLSPWKDDPDRPREEAEEALNASFHDFLNARATKVFPMVFFQHEQRQQSSLAG